MEPELLSTAQVCFKLRCGEHAVYAMLRRGEIVGVKVPRPRGPGWAWRIFWPPRSIVRYLEQIANPMEFAPMLGAGEVAEILGVTQSTLRAHIRDKRIVPASKEGKYVYFSVMEVRRYLYAREQRQRKSKTPTIQRMIQWFREKQTGHYPDHDPVDEALKAVLLLPEAERKVELAKLLEKIDRAEALFDAAL